MKYPDVSNVYHLKEGKFISVDQTSNDEDRTVLLIGEKTGDHIFIKEIKYTEKQMDMDKYIDDIKQEIVKKTGVKL